MHSGKKSVDDDDEPVLKCTENASFNRAWSVHDNGELVTSSQRNLAKAFVTVGTLESWDGTRGIAY